MRVFTPACGVWPPRVGLLPSHQSGTKRPPAIPPPQDDVIHYFWTLWCGLNINSVLLHRSIGTQTKHDMRCRVFFLTGQMRTSTLPPHPLSGPLPTHQTSLNYSAGSLMSFISLLIAAVGFSLGPACPKNASACAGLYHRRMPVERVCVCVMGLRYMEGFKIQTGPTGASLFPDASLDYNLCAMLWKYFTASIFLCLSSGSGWILMGRWPKNL